MSVFIGAFRRLLCTNLFAAEHGGDGHDGDNHDNGQDQHGRETTSRHADTIGVLWLEDDRLVDEVRRSVWHALFLLQVVYQFY